jgi:hypothetical protein
MIESPCTARMNGAIPRICATGTPCPASEPGHPSTQPASCPYTAAACPVVCSLKYPGSAHVTTYPGASGAEPFHQRATWLRCRANERAAQLFAAARAFFVLFYLGLWLDLVTITWKY